MVVLNSNIIYTGLGVLPSPHPCYVHVHVMYCVLWCLWVFKTSWVWVERLTYSSVYVCGTFLECFVVLSVCIYIPISSFIISHSSYFFSKPKQAPSLPPSPLPPPLPPHMNVKSTCKRMTTRSPVRIRAQLRTQIVRRTHTVICWWRVTHTLPVVTHVTLFNSVARIW